MGKLGVLLALALAGIVPASAGAAEPGVQAHLLWSSGSSGEVERQLDLIDEAGATYVRVDGGWSSLEPKQKGTYASWYLDRIDRVVQEAEERSLELIFTFWETPCWASTAPDSLKQDCSGSWWSRGVQRYAPRNASDYANALAFVVERYGDRVDAWEIWNEPNHGDFLKGGDQVADYARILKAAYPAAKRADPNSTILGGSLAGSDFQFTKALLDQGVKDKFDGWSIHPYSEDRSPLDPWLDRYVRNSFIRGVPAVRDVLEREGDAEPLWLTEFGWSTCNVRNQPQAYRNCVGESQQADWLELAFEQMQRWDYVKVGIWFNLKDTTTNAADKSRNFGLLKYDGSRKAAYGALKSWTAEHNSVREASEPSPGLTLTADARNSVIRDQGRAATSSAVKLRAYRYLRSRDRFTSEPRHELSFEAGNDGRYSGRIPASELADGRWKIIARATLEGESVRRTDQVRWRD
ncbi:hypothetical protein BH18ACT13_BH18ACT13_21510 [soil metagenome]